MLEIIRTTFIYFIHFFLRDHWKEVISSCSRGLCNGTSTIRLPLRLKPQARDICLCSEAMGHEAFTNHFTKHHSKESFWLLHKGRIWITALCSGPNKTFHCLKVACYAFKNIYFRTTNTNMKLYVLLKGKSLIVILAYVMSNTCENNILAPLQTYDPIILKLRKINKNKFFRKVRKHTCTHIHSC